MKHLKFFFIFAVLLTIGTTAYGQNVTVKPSNGNTIPAVKGEGAGDTFFGHNGFAMWKHNQLNLTMTTADGDGLQVSEKSGQFSNPANNIFNNYTTNNQGVVTANNLQLGRGTQQDCYVAFTLPKGYRFTKYTIQFRRNINTPAGWTGGDGGSGQASFGEVYYGEEGKTNWSWYDSGSADIVTKYEGFGYSASGARMTISRSSLTGMDNTLYFKLINSSDNRVFLNLESIEFEFTAEADYTPVTPAGSTLNRSAVDIPFSTSTVDIGTVESRHYNNSDRISYSYENVKDLYANLTLFEAESVKSGTNFDGISGNVVDYKEGSITSNGDYFQIGKAGTKEQIYYIESPTYVVLPNGSGTQNPIGFRITGAKINYTYGQARPARTETVTENVLVGTKTYPTFYISADVEFFTRSLSWSGYTYTSTGTTTYYLTSNAGMSTTESNKATWFIDDDGYIRLANDPDKYLKNKQVNGTNNRMAVIDPASETPAKFNINANGQIELTANTNQKLVFRVRMWDDTHARDINNYGYFYLQQNTNNGPYATRTLTGYTKTINIYETHTETVNFPAFTPSSYKLRVYDATGTTFQEREVNSTADDGYIEVKNMNNDAVKIGIIGVGLIEGSITMQALDPYIDRIDIVCQEAKETSEGSGIYEPTLNGRNLTQTFTASDFAVSGGAFHFYMPEDFVSPCLFTFENLHSNYGDNTYYNNTASTNNARYSFVKSEYWNDHADLYASSYSPNSNYEDKISTDVKGTKEFVFNNAAVIGNSGGTYEEYPFTLGNYANEGGNFDQLFYTNAELDPEATPTQKTAYLFTCDETRYNISTATATQHRTYAFYKMDITAQRENYYPDYEWTKIYDKSLSRNADGTVNTDAQWGLKLKTTEAGEGEEKYGYLTVGQIVNALTDANNDYYALDANGTTAPKSASQILYIDGSELLAIVEDTYTTTEDGQQVTKKRPMNDIKNILGKNAVVFLPNGTTTSSDNFAYLNDAGTFTGAGNFVMTDMNPFYTPYNIYLQDEGVATYQRQIEKDTYAKATAASIIMPFVLAVDSEGKHTNANGTEPAFSLHTMQIDNALTHQSGKDYAYFPELPANVSATNANKPYLVKVLQEGDGENISFVVSQKATTIAKTEGFQTGDGALKYTFTGETANGTLANGTKAGTYSFTNHGTFAGAQLDVSSKKEGYFYFANSMFLSSDNLKASITKLNLAPFRAFYTSEAQTETGAKMSGFDIIFGEGIGDSPTGINDVTSRIDTGIRAGKGTITIMSAIDNNVKIYTAGGMNYYNIDMQAGETKTVEVPAGIYIVNGVKIIVK